MDSKSSLVCWRQNFTSCLFCHGRLKSPQFVCCRNSDMWRLSLLLGVVLLQSHSLACRMYVFVCFVKLSQNFPRYTKVHFRWWFVTPHLKLEATSWVRSLLHLRWNYQALATVETHKWQPGGKADYGIYDLSRNRGFLGQHNPFQKGLATLPVAYLSVRQSWLV